VGVLKVTVLVTASLALVCWAFWKLRPGARVTDPELANRAWWDLIHAVLWMGLGILGITGFAVWLEHSFLLAAISLLVGGAGISQALQRGHRGIIASFAATTPGLPEPNRAGRRQKEREEAEQGH
jgi:hypothetical protein